MTEKHQKMVEELYEIYLYTFPLVVLDLHFKALTNTELPTPARAPINQYLHAKGVASAEDKEIVHPNIDTVYSKAHMNLKEEPLYLHKPSAGRYVSAEIIDAYGNCVGIVGSGGIGGKGEIGVVLAGPDYTGEIPEGLLRIDVPTNLCWTLTRILEDGNREEIERIQGGFDLRPLSAYQREYCYPKGEIRKEYEFVPYEKLGQLTPEEFFAIVNRIIGDNLGDDPDMEILANAEKYGIGDGLQFRFSNFDREVQAALQGFYQRACEEFIYKTRNHVYSEMRDRWILSSPALARFGRQYSFRAKVAWGGFGALPVSVANYPHIYVDSEGRPLHGRYQYVMHFSSLPPVGEFWSLTAYGENQFLIPNELGRNGFNDRSSFRLNADGTLDLYIQRERPEEGKLDNWLPIGEDAFGMVLRLYSAEEAFLDGSWKLPQVIRVNG